MVPPITKGYLITLGQTPQLSLLELRTVLARLQISGVLTPVNLHQYHLADPDLSVSELITLLGGTVKIAKILAPSTLELIPDVIANRLLLQPSRFTVSSFTLDQNRQKTLAQTVKNHLRLKKLSVGFRLLKHPLASAGIVEKFTEFQVNSFKDYYLVAQVIAVQDINRWSRKDYGRPQIDPHSGMLPPKIARIMVNLALPHRFPGNALLVDPFCGTGTILMEGLDLGLDVLGSDLSPVKVSQSAANCAWFSAEFDCQSNFRVLHRDATKLSLADVETPPAAIVFEGYLGPPTLKGRNINNLWKGLEKLYLGTFKNLKKLLPSGVRIVCALPQYRLENTVKTLDSLIDRCEKYGYTLLENPLTYGRESATIKRSIYLLAS